jgi:DNA-directed RNA polymerase subunit RPC12/RpoP
MTDNYYCPECDEEFEESDLNEGCCPYCDSVLHKEGEEDD